MMDIKTIGEHIQAGAGKALERLKTVEQLTNREVKDTYLASEILLRLMRGQNVSPDEIAFLKGQSVNVAKVLALLGLQAIPGSSLGIVLLEKVVQKHGFSLFPQVLNDPDAADGHDRTQSPLPPAAIS